MHRCIRACKGGCWSTAGWKGCECGVKILKYTGGFVTIGAAIAYGFAIYLQNVSIDRYHYPYVCTWIFAIIQIFAIVLELSCFRGNILVRLFLQLMSYLLTSFSGVMFFESVFDFYQCANANAPVTDGQCRACYMTFIAASAMTVGQIITGLVANNSVQEKKGQYEVL
eukprot:TRINITY_DN11612_c0_g1_i1.p1 TRINITY_DN11612_c0_g1~~TRINITY_DN11612_c0_g1_i1.p1  ORF type:complete len:168 (-),score=21.73 TRINITY_DN11612_c0_g1_i1:27-530(-)